MHSYQRNAVMCTCMASVLLTVQARLGEAYRTALAVTAAALLGRKQ